MMNPVRFPLLPSAVAALIALPAIAGAQGRGGSTRDTVPVSMLPPAGKCRIWMFGVPAAQQPATTDCATALRQKPANGMVLYGPAQRGAESERFDPKVGEDPRGTKANDLRNNGSRAEQNIERRRQADQRARQLDERRERDERARRDAMDRAALASRAPTRDRNPSSPSGGGTTAVPRSSAANSTGSGSSSPPPSPPKAPPEGKKKPE